MSQRKNKILDHTTGKRITQRDLEDEDKIQYITQKQLESLAPDDIYYYNVNMSNNSNINQKIIFNQTLSADIVNNPKSYFACVVRFSVDASVIQLLFFPIDTFYVTLTYGSFTSGPLALIPPPGPQEPATVVTLQPSVAVYSYQDFLQSLNTGYASALALLITASGGVLSPIASATPPFFLFNCQTGLISMYASSAFYLETISTPIKIFMDYTLYDLFNNFQINYFGQGLPSFLDVQIRVIDKYGSNISSFNSALLEISQEGSNCTRFYEPQLIRFKSQTMGFRKEYVQNPNLTATVNPTGTTAGIPSSTTLIDFCPSFNSTEIIGWRQNLVYNASFSYRLIDIIADKMNTVDISVYWTSQNGNEHDFYLPPASSSQIKLAFIKKSVIKFQ